MDGLKSNNRRSERRPLQIPACVVIDPNHNPNRIPCLIVDLTTKGFRLRGNFNLSPGQVVQVILEHQPQISVQSRVVWVGKTDSKQEGEFGLEVV
jgi:PilZ domain-containing protein